MSRGFVKEEDALPPPVVPPRAPLPAGVPNYVTPRGLRLLRAELTALEAERGQLDVKAQDAQARTQLLLVLNGRISALTARLTGARVVAPRNPPPPDVRFGATVRFRPAAGGAERELTIVGVDEADADQGLIAFTAPIARAVLGHRTGQRLTLHAAGGAEELEVVSITYHPDSSQ